MFHIEEETIEKDGGIGMIEFFRASPFMGLELGFSRDDDNGRELQWCHIQEETYVCATD